MILASSVADLSQWLGRLALAAKKNPFGMTREEAKKAYFRFHNRGAQDEEVGHGGEDPDVKLDRIMRYMEETNSKLSKIEEDIEFLKQQVGLILKKL